MPETTVLFENEKFKIELRTDSGVLTCTPSGTVDEDVNFAPILNWVAESGPRIQELRFDLGHIRRLNSCGVREWLLLVERLGTQVNCAFINVNEIFIEQANMIPNTFGRRGTPVRSFQAPYACTKCNQSYAATLKPEQVKFENGSPQPPALKCEKCGGPLSFDSIADEYFGFLKAA